MVSKDLMRLREIQMLEKKLEKTTEEESGYSGRASSEDGLTGRVFETQSEGGTKYDAGKPRMDLLVPEADELTAMVLGFGAEKYGPFNWMNGIAYSRLHAALRRHLGSWAKGEDRDPESGLPHLAHARCCLDFLIWMSINREDLDDRPSPSLRNSKKEI
jgi:hypothetical protein